MFGPLRRLALLILAAALTAGCTTDGPPTGTVVGQVTLDGEPLATGNIQFRPIAGDAGTGGGPITDGKFEAVVPVANMRVEITASKVIGTRKAYPTPNSPEVDDVVELIPKQYNVDSKLTLDVKEGRQEARFDLQSK